jgi:hypothetical protein
MSSLRKSSQPPRHSGAGSIVVLVDPFWIGNLALSRTALNAIEKQIGYLGNLLRVYWYLDAYSKDLDGFEARSTTLRILGRDDLEDGFELIKAIDADMESLCAHVAGLTVVLGSLDDRLLLSVERLKQRGCKVIGLLSTDVKGDEGSVRMLRQFDDTIVLSPVHTESEREMGAIEEAQLNQVVTEWLPTQEESALDFIRQYTANRPGIPREVDSRLLFLSSRALNRELSNAEKIYIRNLVRASVNPEH